MRDVKETHQQKPIWAGATRGSKFLQILATVAKIVANDKVNDDAALHAQSFVLSKGAQRRSVKGGPTTFSVTAAIVRKDISTTIGTSQACTQQHKRRLSSAAK